MSDCVSCKYAVWDCESYYGTTSREYFVSGCKLALEEDGCEEYEEGTHEHTD